MTPARKIIGKFGGISAAARALGHKNVSTVQGWCERGVIPIRQQASVFAAAERLGIHLSFEEFVPVPPSVDPRPDDRTVSAPSHRETDGSVSRTGTAEDGSVSTIGEGAV